MTLSFLSFFIFRSFALLLFLSLSLLQLMGCASLPNTKKIPVAKTEHTIYFIYRNWHTSLLLDATTVAKFSQHLKTEAADQKYVRIGWGDGDYFTGKNRTWSAATKALVVSSYSALQVITYEQPPFAVLPEGTWVSIAITEKGMRKLIRYLDASFALDSIGRPIQLQAYAQDTGHFYQAKGHYSVLSNCNTWSGRALQSAGLPVKSALHLTAQSVFEQARFISQYQDLQGVAR